MMAFAVLGRGMLSAQVPKVENWQRTTFARSCLASTAPVSRKTSDCACRLRPSRAKERDARPLHRLANLDEQEDDVVASAELEAKVVLEGRCGAKQQLPSRRDADQLTLGTTGGSIVLSRFSGGRSARGALTMNAELQVKDRRLTLEIF
jgi:hypothetical protein